MFVSCAHHTVQKATIQQVTTMLATSENVLFPGHNHLVTTGYWWPDTLIIAGAPVEKKESTVKKSVPSSSRKYPTWILKNTYYMHLNPVYFDPIYPKSNQFKI